MLKFRTGINIVIHYPCTELQTLLEFKGILKNDMTENDQQTSQDEK